MGQLGDLLRETREAKGLSLEQVEQNTRIRLKLLEALEQENYQELPAPVFVKGFLRNYAMFLGLDAQQVLQLYKDAVGNTDIPYELHALREPLEPEPSHAPVYLGIVAIVALLAIAGWIVVQQGWLRLPDIREALSRRATATASPSPTSTPTSTQVALASTSTMSPTASLTNTAAPTESATGTSTAKPTGTPSPAATRTGTATVSLTSTVRTTGTSTATASAQRTSTASRTATQAASRTLTPGTPTAQTAAAETPVTPTAASATRTVTLRAATVTRTATVSGTLTVTPSATEAYSTTAAIHIQLEILANVWLRVYSDGAKIFEGEATQGETRDFTAEGQLYVHAAYGNAVRAVANGEEYGLLGTTVDPVRIEWAIAPGTPSVVSTIQPTQVVLPKAATPAH